MRYKVIKRSVLDERVFTLEDTLGNRYEVDIITDGAFDHPDGVDKTEKTWHAWLDSFIGKELEIEKVTAYVYFSSGYQKII